MATVTALRKPKITVGFLIDQMSELRDKKRDLKAQEKVLNAEFETLEAQLIEMMDAEGVTKSTGKVASAGISESQQFNNDDWDAFMAFVARTKQFHLVQRRTSAEAVRELFKMKGAVPGLSVYTKRVISLRDL